MDAYSLMYIIEVPKNSPVEVIEERQSNVNIHDHAFIYITNLHPAKKQALYLLMTPTNIQIKTSESLIVNFIPKYDHRIHN